MPNKTKIKVIKKKYLQTTKKIKKDERKSKQESVRRMVQTVSNWVSDFQNSQQLETKKAFESLFSTPPQIDGI